MGNSAFPFSESLPPSLALLAPQARAQPSPSERVQSFVLQRTLEYDPPGSWAGNKYEEQNHYLGVVAIAIKAYMDAIAGAKFTLLQRKIAQSLRKSGSYLYKSVGGSGNYSRDDDYEPAEHDHPLSKVLEQPGGEDGAWSMAQECTFLTLQHMLTGDAPAWVPLNDSGKPVRFFSLTSALTQPLFAAGTNPQYPKGAYKVTPYGGGGGGFYMAGGLLSQAILPGEEVKRFREFHPWSRNMGMSRLAVGAKEIDVLEAIMQSRWAMFDHGMQLDVVAIVPGLSKDETEAMSATMTAKQGGSKNARRFAVLAPPMGGQDKFSIQTFGQSAREMDYGTSYDQQAGVALALFRVPKGVAGFTSQTSYSQHYAEIQQFWDLGVIPFCRAYSVFLSQALAQPWSESPGELKIEVEACKPTDVEMDAKEREFAVQNDLSTVNEYRRATNRDALPEGDVPKSVYSAKLQQQFAPQPAQQLPPGATDGMGAPGDEQQADADPLAALLGGDEEQQAEGDAAEDSPEDTQNAVVAAALASMGLAADDGAGGEGDSPEPDAIQKAERQKRNEGDKWQSGGKWYTKKNGNTYEIAAPGGAKPETQKPAPTQGGAGANLQRIGEGAGAIAANMYSAVQDSIEKTGDVPKPDRAAGSTFAQAWDMVKGAGLHTHPEAAKRFVTAAQEASRDPRSFKGGKDKAEAWRDALNKHFAGANAQGQAGAKPAAPAPQQGAASAPEAKQPAAAEQADSPATTDPNAISPEREKLHAAIVKTKGAKSFGFNAITLAKLPEQAVKTIAAQLGIIPAESVIAPHVTAKVPATAHKETLSNAKEWATQMADKHADKVAAHFGVSREQAHKILVRAIVMVAEHASKNGGQASGNIKLGGKQLKVGVKQKPKGNDPAPASGAVPKPANPASQGSLPPRGGVAKALVRPQLAQFLSALSEAR